MNVKDKYGVKLKFPERTCKDCEKHPCFIGMEMCSSDFAKYGCVHWVKKLNNDNTCPTSS